jgi:hypothetical protein
MAEQLQHTILWGTGHLHSRCSIASSGRNRTRRKHRNPLVHHDVGLSQSLGSHLPWLCVTHLATLRNTAVFHRATARRIVRKFPGFPWGRIWINFNASTVPDTVKSAWFAAIHDIVPTNETSRHPSDELELLLTVWTGLCNKINECGEGRLIRTWTRLGMILLMDPRHIPPD